jgi:hypothetical protein
MTEEPQPDAMISDVTVYQLQYQDEDGNWINWINPRADRDEVTRIQVSRARNYPDEKRRVIGERRLLWVDEVEGDGEGETSKEALIARNEESTKRLLGHQNLQHPDQ